jgi:hypothetical protein
MQAGASTQKPGTRPDVHQLPFVRKMGNVPSEPSFSPVSPVSQFLESPLRKFTRSLSFYVIKAGLNRLTVESSMRMYGMVGSVAMGSMVLLALMCVEAHAQGKNSGAAELSGVVKAGQTQVNSKDGLTYVWIPPGTFMMGCSPLYSECYGNEKPAHSVTITKGLLDGADAGDAGGVSTREGIQSQPFSGRADAGGTGDLVCRQRLLFRTRPAAADGSGVGVCGARGQPGIDVRGHRFDCVVCKKQRKIKPTT